MIDLPGTHCIELIPSSQSLHLTKNHLRTVLTILDISFKWVISVVAKNSVPFSTQTLKEEGHQSKLLAYSSKAARTNYCLYFRTPISCLVIWLQPSYCCPHYYLLPCSFFLTQENSAILVFQT